MDIEHAHKVLIQFLSAQNEFLFVNSTGGVFEMKREEVELTNERGRLLISFISDKGFQTWRVSELKTENSEIDLKLTRNFDKVREEIRVVPRISSSELDAGIEIARIEKANQISQLFIKEIQNSKLIRVQLNRENGRFAEIIVECEKIPIAVLADVSASVSPELFLTSSIKLLAKLERRKKNPMREIWILAEPKKAKSLQKLHALLDDNWRRKLNVFECDETKEKGKITRKLNLRIAELWRDKPAKLRLSEKTNISETATEIVKLSTDKIDCIAMKSGESLRFNGLRFARVRDVFGAEKCWFGIERRLRILSDGSFCDFEKMVSDLENYRDFESPNRRHEFYRQSPEAWLEAILRRNIKLLDANLVLSPIYNQFRAANDKIDLLALRRDGRLVIIELKVTPDREMIFQGLDYWRKVELQRKKGVLNEAKIFGDFEIADAPTIVYLVAPGLSFHQDFRFFASTISKEIEIYRFELAENWREDVKVLSRDRI